MKNLFKNWVDGFKNFLRSVTKKYKTLVYLAISKFWRLSWCMYKPFLDIMQHNNSHFFLIKFFFLISAF